MANRDLNEKVVVITGASSGFGKGAAIKFTEAGASVVLAARRAQLLEELARECELRGGRTLTVPADVSKQEDVERLAQAAITGFGRIDIWVNNAGVGAVGRFEDVPLADHVQVIETDLFGTIYGSYFALRQFRAQRSGTLINIASVLGKIPSPYCSSYVAAKHGVVGLSGAIRQELQEEHLEEIHVCTVMPTSMDTPFFDHAANYTGHETQPIPPLYDPQKVIDVIVRLATDPQDEVTVGGAGMFMVAAHKLARGVLESIMAKQTHKAQIEDAPVSTKTSGSIREPSPAGAGVSGGRMKK
jgi:short-subunit dehydrogenase